MAQQQASLARFACLLSAHRMDRRLAMKNGSSAVCRSLLHAPNFGYLEDRFWVIIIREYCNRKPRSECAQRCVASSKRCRRKRTPLHIYLRFISFLTRSLASSEAINLRVRRRHRFPFYDVSRSRLDFLPSFVSFLPVAVLTPAGQTYSSIVLIHGWSISCVISSRGAEFAHLFFDRHCTVYTMQIACVSRHGHVVTSTRGK